MDFKQIVMDRYAVKKFDGKKIPNEKVNELMELIRFAPSSFNIQPWKIKIITDQKLKEQLKPAAYGQEQVTTCSHLLVFCANTDIIGNITKLEEQMRTSKVPEENIKSYIGMMTGAFKDSSEEYRLSWAQKQLYIALENALLGSKALGFDSCPMEGFDPEQFSKILKLPKNLIPSVLCPIGYAVDKPNQKSRFSKEEIFF